MRLVGGGVALWYGEDEDGVLVFLMSVVNIIICTAEEWERREAGKEDKEEWDEKKGAVV